MYKYKKEICILAAMLCLSSTYATGLAEYDGTTVTETDAKAKLTAPTRGDDAIYSIGDAASTETGAYSVAINKYLWEEGTYTISAESYYANVSAADVTDYTRTARLILAADSEYIDETTNTIDYSSVGNGSTSLWAGISNTLNLSDYTLTGDYIGLYYSVTTSSAIFGLAVSNTGTLDAVVGDFIGNKSSKGNSSYTLRGILYNSGTIGSITGDFTGNTLASNNGRSIGGAIYNEGKITTISGDFTSNLASVTNSGAVGSSGGAVYNDGTITTINGDFAFNAATATSGYALGGAIYNSDTINSITGDFIANYTNRLSNNSATNSLGGAIYNTGDINTVSGNFIANSARAAVASVTVEGGAVYNAVGATIAFLASDSSMEFTGNYTQDSTGTKTFNAIHNEGTVNFDAYNDYTISVNDSISGDSEYQGSIYVNSGTSESYSTVNFNSSVSYQDISVNNGTLALGSFSETTLSIAGTEIVVTATSAALNYSKVTVDSGATLSVGTSVALTSSSINLKSGSTLILEASAALTFDADSTLALYLTEGGDFSVTINVGTDAAINSSTDVYTFLSENLDVFFGEEELTVSADNGSFTFVSSDESISGSYDITSTNDGYTITGSLSGAAVPEPSTYAMIFGVIALGFAYYRRRK